MSDCIAITRTGSPIYFGSEAGARGELDTVPFIERLVATYTGRIIVFGALRGDVPPDDEHVTYINIDMRDVNPSGDEARFTRPDVLIERIMPYAQIIAEYQPKCVFDCWGATPTWSWTGNPNGALPYDFAVLYSAPMLFVMKYLNEVNGFTPRFGIVTDPKCYKRDLEMATIWPEIIPAAVLSQEKRMWDRKLQGKRFRTWAAYARCENWLTWQWECIPNTNDFPCVIMANTHVNAGLLAPGRDEVWLEILNEVPDDTVVFGSGWDKVPYAEWDRLRYVGVLPTTDDVRAALAQCYGGPMICQMPGFMTTKARIYAMSGALPLAYGLINDDPHPLAYDRDCRVFAPNDMLRWIAGRDVEGQTCLNISDKRREFLINHILELTTPNFSLLDHLLSEINDMTREGMQSVCKRPLWLDQFGGYVCHE